MTWRNEKLKASEHERLSRDHTIRYLREKVASRTRELDAIQQEIGNVRALLASEKVKAAAEIRDLRFENQQLRHEKEELEHQIQELFMGVTNDPEQARTYTLADLQRDLAEKNLEISDLCTQLRELRISNSVNANSFAEQRQQLVEAMQEKTKAEGRMEELQAQHVLLVSDNETLSQENSRLHKELTRLQKKCRTLTTDYSAIVNEKSSLERRLEETEQSNETVLANLHDVDSQLDEILTSCNTSTPKQLIKHVTTQQSISNSVNTNQMTLNSHKYKQNFMRNARSWVPLLSDCAAVIELELPFFHQSSAFEIAWVQFVPLFP
jgi:chromosome segregation ATPase